MSQKNISEILAKVNDSEMASVKSVISGIIRLLSDPNSSIKDIKEVILVDPPLLSKVLKLANSVYYSPSTPIEDIGKALVMIGFDATLELALNQKACKIFGNTNQIGDYTAAALWENNVAVALFGKYMFRREFKEKGDRAYIAGILHNIGIIAMDQFLHEEFIDIVQESEKSNQNLYNIELDRLGFSHAQLGQAIIEDWQLPLNISSAIEFHHKPQEAQNDETKLAQVLYIADYFCAHKKIGFADAPNQSQDEFINIIEQLDISPESFKLIGKDVVNEISRMKESGLI